MTAGRNINSQSVNWNTPLKYIDAITGFFNTTGFEDRGICLDPCSNEFSIVNAKIEYKLPQNGLKESWDCPTIFVNPPYGSTKGSKIKDWLRMCNFAHQTYNSEVIALVPVATNTSHWKEYVFNKASVICFCADTRLKFLVEGKEGGKGAPMACALIYYGSFPKLFCVCFSKLGACMKMAF